MIREAKIMIIGVVVRSGFFEFLSYLHNDVRNYSEEVRATISHVLQTSLMRPRSNMTHEAYRRQMVTL